jgi:hypothetical protein
MRFRRKGQTEPEPSSTASPTDDLPIALHAHRYSIRFDIFPEISYLDDQLCRLIADLLPLCKEFPEGMWISRQTVEEGLDSCSINFWAFAEEPDAIKDFSIWFQGFFREESVAEFLERFVQHALEKPGEAEVILADWSRIHVTEDEVRTAVEGEMMTKAESASDNSKNGVDK